MLTLLDLGCDPFNKLGHPILAAHLNEYNIRFDEKDEAIRTLEHARKSGEPSGVVKQLERMVQFRQTKQDQQEELVVRVALELDYK